MAKRWTKKERRALLMGAGSFGLDWLRAQTDSPSRGKRHRSEAAIKRQAQRMGIGGLTRGAYTVRALCQSTGYSRTQLERAQRALRLKWRRTSAHGRFLITDEQRDDMLAWLKHDYWSKPLKLYCCVWCAGSRKPHRASGLCVRCAKRHFRMCIGMGLPSSLRKQLAIVVELLKQKQSVESREFLEGMRVKLGRGLAMTRGQLDWLFSLTPGELACRMR